MDPISVVVVDNDYFFCQGLCAALERPGEPAIELLGAVDTADAALRLVEKYAPDVLITDLKLGQGKNEDVVKIGLDVIVKTKALSPRTKVLAMTGHDERIDWQLRSIRLGAKGYIIKTDQDATQIREAIALVMQGYVFYSQQALQRLHQMVQSELGTHDHDVITPRERDVLVLLAQDYANKQIAEALDITEKTVKCHVSNILSKLSLKNRTEAAIYFHQQLLPPSS